MSKKSLRIFFGIIAVLAGIATVGFLAMQSPYRVVVQKKQIDTVETTQSAPRDEMANERTYTNEKYGYRFRYPEEWTLRHASNMPVRDDIVLTKGENSIEIKKMTYGNSASGSVLSRESFLKKLLSDRDVTDKILLTGGQGYSIVRYAEKAERDVPVPTFYLVGEREIFVMTYTIFDFSKTSLTDAEASLREVAETFSFIIPQASENTLRTYALEDNSYSFFIPNGWNVEEEKMLEAEGENGEGESATVRLNDAEGNIIDLDINKGLGGVCGVLNENNASKQFTVKGTRESFTVCDYDFHWETLESSVGVAGKFTFKSSDPKEQVKVMNAFLAEFGEMERT